MAYATSNPSTGFEWQETDGGCKGLSVKKHYIQNPTPNGQVWVGVPGKQYFQFTVDSTPETTEKCELGFSYVRPWMHHENSPLYTL